MCKILKAGVLVLSAAALAGFCFGAGVASGIYNTIISVDDDDLDAEFDNATEDNGEEKAEEIKPEEVKPEDVKPEPEIKKEESPEEKPGKVEKK